MKDEANNAATQQAGDTPAKTDDTLDLRALAMQAEAGEDVDAIIAEKSAKKTTTTPAKDAPAEVTKKEGEPQPEADKTPDTAKTKEAPKDEKKKSEYEQSKERKKAADEERFDRNWKKLNEEKEQLRKERETLEAERKKVAQPAAKAEPSKDARGFTAADYEKTAKELEADGDAGAARVARLRAAELKAKDEEAAKSVEPPRSAPGEAFDFVAEAEALYAQDPTLRDIKNPLTAEANRLLKDPDWSKLFLRPGGVRAAVEAAKVSLEARAAAGLREELAKANKELEQLRQATGMGGSPAVPRKSAPAGGGNKPLTDEQMLALAEQADRES